MTPWTTQGSTGAPPGPNLCLMTERKSRATQKSRAVRQMQQARSKLWEKRAGRAINCGPKGDPKSSCVLALSRVTPYFFGPLLLPNAMMADLDSALQ